jgi:NADP-dependent 3-hydroxy acid dehydrogenase YdfG
MAALPVAVIIGYGSGIGHQVALKWSVNGYAVALVSRTQEKLDAAVKLIPNAKAFAADVSDADVLTATLGAIEASMGEISSLIYNASAGIWKNYDQITQEQLDRGFKVSVNGFLAAAQFCCPKMEARGKGFVCVTGATASKRGMPFTSAFAAAKAAQRSLAQSIARQLWSKGVHVAYAIIDASVGEGEKEMKPSSIAARYWQLHEEPSDCFTFEAHLQTSQGDLSLL